MLWFAGRGSLAVAAKTSQANTAENTALLVVRIDSLHPGDDPQPTAASTTT